MKEHESEVNKVEKVDFGMGSLALVVKGMSVVEDGSESDQSEYELMNEEFTLMVSNPKRFARKKFPSNRNRNWQGSYSFEKVKEESKSTSQKDEDKNEKKIMGL